MTLLRTVVYLPITILFTAIESIRQGVFVLFIPCYRKPHKETATTYSIIYGMHYYDMKHFIFINLLYVDSLVLLYEVVSHEIRHVYQYKHSMFVLDHSIDYFDKDEEKDAFEYGQLAVKKYYRKAIILMILVIGMIGYTLL